MSKRSWRTVLVNSLLVLSSTTLAFAGLELVLRLREPRRSFPEPVRWNANTLRLHQRSDDPVLRYELRPGAVVERDRVVYRINAQGLRAGVDLEAKRPGERRLVVLGDSVAFGMAMEEEDTFPHRIEGNLRREGLDVRVLNESVLGYKTAQEVRLFERDGVPLRPDGVVVAFCLNDFDDYSPELTLLDPSTRLPFGNFRRLPPRRFSGIDLPDPVPLLDRSLVFRALSQRFLREDYYRWIGTDPARRAEVATELGRLGRLLADRHIPGLIAIIPILLDGDYPYEDIHEFVAQRAADANLSVVDLRKHLRGQSLAALRLRAEDVLHLNARGHEQIARVLTPCLADASLHCPPEDQDQPGQ